MIEEALAVAREELNGLHAREAELQDLIARAEAALGQAAEAARSSPADRLTLHDALAQVLQENDNRWMTVRELAEAVNGRGLYLKRDGSPLEINQVHARTNNYSDLFEKQGANVRLREEPKVFANASPRITIFRDDDDGFFEWLEDNAEGYVINTERNPKPAYLVLHKPDCPHFKGDATLRWTKDYVKVCARDRADLQAWAVETVGGEVALCGSCFG